MKRVVALIFAFLIGFAIYYDLTVGTLPGIQASEGIAAQKEASLPYVEIQVHPGDTVLSIIERHGGIPENVAIEEIITDFSTLNDGLDPLNIQPGKIYKFPLYSQEP